MSRLFLCLPRLYPDFPAAGYNRLLVKENGSYMSEQPRGASSPNSTGGGGTHFEQHVDAAFLAWLLVRAIPPVLTDCTLSAIHLQTERLGWKTDDLVVVAQNGAGQERKLVCQVKQTIKVSAADDEFTKTIERAWRDFKNQELFDRKTDRLAIITLRGTDAFLRHFAGLLECARASRTVDEFVTRLDISGFVHAKVVHYFGDITKIVKKTAKGEKVDRNDIWEFLRLVHTLSFDLNTSTRQTESQVKSLLALTAGGADPISAANATWNELLREVGEGKPQAKSYRRDDLAQELRDRHSPIGNREQASLQRLKEHSQPILDGIRTTIGLAESSIELPRERLIHSILERIQDAGIVLISGSAGSGKSAVAKRVLEQAAPDYFTFTFRAEEFAVSHLDKTLHNAQTDVNGVSLGAILSGQSKKLLLIESVERLLEATTRDAFADLLSLLANDPSWHLILTCRDYSTDLVRSSLLQLVNVGHVIVPVPSFDDAELDAVAAACPAVSQPLANDRLRKLLRNPYMLDKATQMPWPENRPLPQNERAFREKFWVEIVRVNHNTAHGMPRRRQDAFAEVALRRARALTLYAPRDGLDDEAVIKLIHDSLLNTSDRTDSLVAPAHDVLEDWAILNWIDEQHVRCSDDLSRLAEMLGVFPAIRRSYRKWLDELVERDPNAADELFTQALTEPSIPAQFRDDTLVSLLRSSDPGKFVQRHTELLFSDNKRLLRRLIHLLRVGCVTTPEWFEGGVGLDFDFHVPDGIAWPCVLELVSSRMSDFDGSDTGLLLGLVEDAAKGVSWQTPYPPGSESIVAVAHWLIPHFDGYRNEEQLKRTLSVIAKLPKCEETKFRSMLAKKERRDSERRDRVSEKFREMILSGMEGNAACRDLPDAVIQATRDCMFMTEKHLEKSRGLGHSMELEPGFGIQPYMQHNAFPASAYQGPFFFLLRHHFALGIRFLIELFNHSAEWYRSRRVPMQYVEPPYKIRLTFADGTTRDQWANGRLWNLYRGTSVGPDSLQSALMALERCLLEVAEIKTDVLDAIMISTLRASESAAITAVAASVATAHPHACPETLLVLLRSQECIQLDRVRMVSESQRSSRLAGILPSFLRHKTHDQERKEADALPHRSRDLENAIANLQLGPNAPRVHEAIDQHLENVPAAEQRSQEDRIWLLALRRMDLRQYEAAGEVIDEHNTETVSDAEPRKMIRIDLRVDDEDVKAMSEESAAEHAEFDKRLGLQMWGIKVFEGDNKSNYDPSLWKSKLQAARDTAESRDQEPLGRSGPEFIAAVCIRDHFYELAEDEVRWCVATVCNAIEETSDNWSRMDRRQLYPMQADRPCAWAVTALIDKPMDNESAERVRKALTLALTHSNDEVRTYATDGVSRNLWESNDDLAMRCVNVLAFEAAAVQSLWKAEQEKSFGDRAELESIEFHVGLRVRSLFYDDIPDDAYENLDVTDWIGSEANRRILSILQRAPHNPTAISAFQRLAEVLVQWWDEDDERRHTGRRRERSQNSEVSLPYMLENFVLRVDANTAAEILAPILEAVDRHPREVSGIIEGIVAAEDRFPSKTNFWPVWQMFADRIKRASWLSHVDREHSDGAGVLSAIFLTRYWKEDIRHWQALSEGAPNGHAHRVHDLFGALPPTSILLDNYVRFLYHIGETCLPAAFERIASRLQSGDTPVMLRRGNTVFMLESLLRRFVYSRPIELKSDASLRESVLYLLDTLVESGSSSAYRMRDDFVTPLSS